MWQLLILTCILNISQNLNVGKTACRNPVLLVSLVSCCPANEVDVS